MRCKAVGWSTCRATVSSFFKAIFSNFNPVFEGLSIAGKAGGLAAFVADSTEALRFRLIRTSQDLKKAQEEDEKEKDLPREGSGGDAEGEAKPKLVLPHSWSAFPPEMSHQIYGEQ